MVYVERKCIKLNKNNTVHNIVLIQFFVTNDDNMDSLTIPFEMFLWIGTNCKKVESQTIDITTRLPIGYKERALIT